MAPFTSSDEAGPSHSVDNSPSWSAARAETSPGDLQPALSLASQPSPSDVVTDRPGPTELLRLDPASAKVSVGDIQVEDPATVQILGNYFR